MHWPETQLSTHYLGINLGPVVIAHSAPLSLVINLHTTLPVTICSHKTNCTICSQRGTQTLKKITYSGSCVTKIICASVSASLWKKNDGIWASAYVIVLVVFACWCVFFIISLSASVCLCRAWLDFVATWEVTTYLSLANIPFGKALITAAVSLMLAQPFSEDVSFVVESTSRNMN